MNKREHQNLVEQEQEVVLIASDVCFEEPDRPEQDEQPDNASPATGLPEHLTVIRLIGRGGMASVWEALDSQLNCRVAVKILHDRFTRDERAAKRFLNEAAITAGLDSNCIGKVLHTGLTNDGIPFIEMEYIEGVTLEQFIEKHGALSPLLAISIASRIADALQHAHSAGIIHRDLKPSNILISQTDDANELQVKVVDFGIAKSSERSLLSQSLTRTGDIFGSPAYMSPEQCLGEPVDQRSDIYSFGCILYKMLTGRNPFACASPVQTIMMHMENEPEPFAVQFSHLKIPASVEAVVCGCLRKNPDSRYSSAALLKKRLDALVSTKQSNLRLRDKFGIFLLRMLALLIDLVVVTLAFSYLTLLGMPNSGVFFSILLVLYCGFFEGVTGTTLGKDTFGLRVCDRNGGPLSLLKSILRVVVLVAAYAATNMYSTIVLLSIVRADMSFVLNAVDHTFLWLSLGTLVSADRIFGRIVTRSPVTIDHPSSKRWSLRLTKLQTTVAILAIGLVVIWSQQSNINSSLTEIALKLPHVKGVSVYRAKHTIAKDSVIKSTDLKQEILPEELAAMMIGENLNSPVGTKSERELHTNELVVSQRAASPSTPDLYSDAEDTDLSK